jgi:hypothetical protein
VGFLLQKQPHFLQKLLERWLMLKNQVVLTLQG